MLRLYNFFPRRVEEFKPLGKTSGLYTCGPTVYDYVHIGNWRTFVFEDILKRVLEFNGFRVKHIMNITDIDDKIIKVSKDLRTEFGKIAKKYEGAFFEDLEKLNVLRADFYPRATEHISLMIKLIEKLLGNGYAYKTDDGVYFSVEKFKNYGRLSGLSKRNLKKGARIDSDLYDKENWADFALWKFPSTRGAVRLSGFGKLTAPSSSKGSPPKSRSGQASSEPVWEAPFGRGRPGWHIECSAMSLKYLDDVFENDKFYPERSRGIDIHTGGVDLLFPHHENEIAQAEAAVGRKFVNFWIEGEHLLVEGQKMAKSLGNIFTLEDITRRGFEPLALRYLFLTAHYRSKLNFTWKALEAAQNGLNNLRLEVANWDEPKIARLPAPERSDGGQGCAGFESDFDKAVNSDLDMPKALAVMWEMVKSDYPSSAKHRSMVLMDRVLGLGLEKVEKARLPSSAKELIKERESMRQKGDFEKADKLRQKLAEMGVEIEDTKEGPKWILRQTQDRPRSEASKRND